MPILVILALILCWPLLEIATFIAVGGQIGIVQTLLLIVTTSVLGGVLLKQQGVAMLTRIRAEMGRGDVPAEAVAHAGMIAVGGIMLLLPGFLSDIVGVALFLPPVRSLLFRLFAGRMRAARARSGMGGGIRIIELDSAEWTATTRPREPQGPLIDQDPR